MSRFETIFSNLGKQPRLLIEAELTPVQGDRFQPTGFPDLGAATYKRPDGTPMLLVESAQSMANRLEEICWNKAEGKIIAPLEGLSHVVVDLGNGTKTSSIQEAHRLNSPRIIEKPEVKSAVTAQVGSADSGVLDIRKLAQCVLKFDAGSVLHGIFLEKVAGRLRLQRLLSSFIEAEGIETVSSGGVKFDHVDPKGEAAKGFGNVPFARTEYAAKRIVAYFNLDLATLRGYGLGDNAEKLIVALAFYKMLRLLNEGMRLRTACDFDMKSLTVTRPAAGVDLSNHAELLSELETALPQMIQACEFGNQPLSV
jgi:CRISPR-associated protein Csb1